MNGDGIINTPMGLMAPASVILSQPFSQELEQLNEAVEEFASSAAARDEAIEAEAAASCPEEVAESDYLISKGLARWSADQYLDEIQVLTAGFLAAEVEVVA